jgi:small subunit ribosomal protein S17
MAETTTEKRGSRKVRKGVVVSKSGEKSVVVQSERRERHPVYGKVVRRFKKFHAHDEANTAKVGDVVTIAETRPLSATKRWRIVNKPEVN